MYVQYIYIYYLLFPFWLADSRIGRGDAHHNIEIVVRVWCTYVLHVVGATHNVSIKGSEEWMTFKEKRQNEAGNAIIVVPSTGAPLVLFRSKSVWEQCHASGRRRPAARRAHAALLSFDCRCLATPATNGRDTLNDVPSISLAVGFQKTSLSANSYVCDPAQRLVLRFLRNSSVGKVRLTWNTKERKKQP